MAVIAGNWKMHMASDQAIEFLAELDLSEVSERHEILLFPPEIYLAALATSEARNPRVQLGPQNIYWEDEGAFTGELSARMASEVGANFVLIGHSERRHVFGETDEEVAHKVRAAQRHGLVPVVCVGETLGERRANCVEEVILRQLNAVIDDLSLGRALIAYEPVWAIGTGETATPKDASLAHETLRERLSQSLGAERARSVAILYGGSVKPSNAGALLSTANVDGVLVGGASLDPRSFAEIAAAAL